MLPNLQTGTTAGPSLFLNSASTASSATEVWSSRWVASRNSELRPISSRLAQHRATTLAPTIRLLPRK